MSPQQFVLWFQGFSQACHHLNPTPQQWEKILETLKIVKEETNECTCKHKTYTYPYKGYMGDNKLVNDAKKQLND